MPFSFPVWRLGVLEAGRKPAVGNVGYRGAQDGMACLIAADSSDIEKAAAAMRPVESSSVLRSILPFYPMPGEELCSE